MPVTAYVYLGGPNVALASMRLQHATNKSLWLSYICACKVIVRKFEAAAAFPEMAYVGVLTEEPSQLLISQA